MAVRLPLNIDTTLDNPTDEEDQSLPRICCTAYRPRLPRTFVTSTPTGGRVFGEDDLERSAAGSRPQIGSS